MYNYLTIVTNHQPYWGAEHLYWGGARPPVPPAGYGGAPAVQNNTKLYVLYSRCTVYSHSKYKVCYHNPTIQKRYLQKIRVSVYLCVPFKFFNLN